MMGRLNTIAESMMRNLFLAVLLHLLLPAAIALAGAESICIDAARTAARRTGVPQEVLLAITAVETGRGQAGRMVPWPWTINDSGAGSWYATRQEAEAAARDILAAGRTSFDSGCFQLNYRWHGSAFATVADMFDPAENALYAARFLRALHEESGDWSVAAGTYHSRTPEYARRYRARFDATLAALGGDAGAPAGPERGSRVNRFPLLQAGGGGVAGSLVPLGL